MAQNPIEITEGLTTHENVLDSMNLNFLDSELRISALEDAGPGTVGPEGPEGPAGPAGPAEGSDKMPQPCLNGFRHWRRPP